MSESIIQEVDKLMIRKHIFVSYRSLELEQALQIAEGLARNGFAVWMDRLDGILPGDNWRDKLQEAVNNSFAMVSIVSRNYLESEWCKREYQLADSLNIPIFPACIGKVETSKMPIEIDSIQYVDFMGGDDSFEERLAELVNGIRNKTSVAPDDAILLPDLTPRNSYRKDVEDRTAESIEVAERLKAKSSFDAIEAEEIKKDLEMLQQQYVAVSHQYRLTIDAVILTKLVAQKVNLRHEYEELEKQLQSLNED